MSGEPAKSHQPVLLTEVLAQLVTDRCGRYVDCTLGMGGHAGALLQALAPAGRVLALDADPEAAAIAARRLAAYRESLTVARANFRDLGAVLDAHGFAPVTGALLDLGLSSYQLDRGTRGLSFAADAPLDMRIDPAEPTTAADIVNHWPEHELEALFRAYGERHARRVARAIAGRRRESPLARTQELADLCARHAARGRLNPATLVFLALRTAVNREAESLQAALAALQTRLAPGGRLAVIAFHSVEDRAVKTAFRAWQREGGWRLLTPKPLVASTEEAAQNPRARSAKLRVIERQ